MKISLRPRGQQHGQILALFALSATVIVLAVGLAVDGGFALAERRGTQNGADFGALAGARIISQWVAGDTVAGTDVAVRNAITLAAQANEVAVTFGSPDGPVYVRGDGSPNGFVGSGSIPPSTVGVKVAASKTWTPYFLGLVGMNSWTASADAVARGGYAASPASGTVFPVGIASSFFDTYSICSGTVSTNPSDPCYPTHMTPGNLNVPGGFGWLKFGGASKCSGFGLGMDPTAGCDADRPFLQAEIGPPSNSYGCCTGVGLPGSADKIGSLPGNKVSADCSYYIDNKIVITVPVWDIAGGEGDGGWYHIIGFAGFQLTACTGGKDIEGVWRQPIFNGPTTSTSTFEGAPLAVQLVK